MGVLLRAGKTEFGAVGCQEWPDAHEDQACGLGWGQERLKALQILARQQSLLNSVLKERRRGKRGEGRGEGGLLTCYCCVTRCGPELASKQCEDERACESQAVGENDAACRSEGEAKPCRSRASGMHAENLRLARPSISKHRAAIGIRGHPPPMAADAMDSTPSTSQVRIHLQSKNDDIQIPDSGPILVSTGERRSHMRCCSSAMGSIPRDCNLIPATMSICADASQSSAATNSPPWSTAYWKRSNPYRWNS